MSKRCFARNSSKPNDASSDACACGFGNMTTSSMISHRRGGDGNDHDSSRAPSNPDVNLVEELNQLSIQERNKVYEDIHGVSKPIEETPGLLQARFVAMQTELDKLPTKTAYDLAWRQNRAFVEDPDFRLAFLRCEEFDAKKAAVRFSNYFELILELWPGGEVLGREITLADLGPEELSDLQHGHVQYLSQRDSAGRAVQFLDAVQLMKIYSSEKSREAISTRACMYLAMRTVLDSVETQRNGFVTICYGVDLRDHKQFNIPKARFLATVSKCFTSVPMRVNSFHFLSNDIRLRPFMFLFQIALGRVVRARFQLHTGTALECKYSLMSYGLPVSTLPTDDEGAITYTKHAKSICRYKKREAVLKSDPQSRNLFWKTAVYLPKNNDILLGRGRPYQDHWGNVSMRDIVAASAEEYDSAVGRGGKAAISQRIVQEIQSKGGRFLKMDESTGWWVLVPDKEAQDKVSQAFRKKREMNRSGIVSAMKPTPSGKRTKIQLNACNHSGSCDNKLESRKSGDTENTWGDVDETTLPSIKEVGDPWLLDGQPDSLSAEELKYLVEGLPLQPSPTRLSDSASSSDSDQERRGNVDSLPAFHDLITHGRLPFVGQLPGTPSPKETGLPKGEPLLAFLESQRDCLKVSPQESFNWLRSQDIVSLEDLREACRDDEFVDLDLKGSGGLKGFKSRPFIRAVMSANRPV